MTYTILSEHPTRFEVEKQIPCDDCQQPVWILTDTIVGYLCDTCAKRLQGAANGLQKYRRTA